MNELNRWNGRKPVFGVHIGDYYFSLINAHILRWIWIKENGQEKESAKKVIFKVRKLPQRTSFAMMN